MTIDSSYVVQALKLWNSWQNAWSPVLTFGQLNDIQRAKVLDIALDLALSAEHLGLTTD
jgi:hypothetical protein